MPHIALTTGGFDNLGCMLPKIGIDPHGVRYGRRRLQQGSQRLQRQRRAKVPSGTSSATSLLERCRPRSKTYDLVLLSCEGQRVRPR